MFFCNMKRIVGLALVILLATALLAGCGRPTPREESGNRTQVAPVADSPQPSFQTPEQTQEAPKQSEEPAEELGVLAGLANNKSAELYTDFKAYANFLDLDIGVTPEDAFKKLEDAGMSEWKAARELSDETHYFFAFADEGERCYIELAEYEGVVYRKTYVVSGFFSYETGLFLTKAIYKALNEKKDDGSIKTLEDIESILGKSFLYSVQFRKRENNDGAFRFTYRWQGEQGGNVVIDANTDQDGVLRGFTGASLPE